MLVARRGKGVLGAGAVGLSLRGGSVAARAWAGTAASRASGAPSSVQEGQASWARVRFVSRHPWPTPELLHSGDELPLKSGAPRRYPESPAVLGGPGCHAQESL